MKRKNSDNKELASMFQFRLFVEMKSAGENRVKRQNELLSLIGVDTNFSNDLTNGIREKCKQIGESGWVLTPYWVPRQNETWYGTWYEFIQNKTPEKILTYFKSDDYKLLNEVIGRSTFQFGNFNWWVEATELFFKKYYLGCAMILTGLLEHGIRSCPIESWRQKVTMFYKEAVINKIEEIYTEEIIEPISRYIDTVLLLPSLDGFINVFFDSGYKFQDGIEPQHLERNWLMHGMTTRDVTEEDCIKLFNANATLCYLKTTVFQVDYTS